MTQVSYAYEKDENALLTICRICPSFTYVKSQMLTLFHRWEQFETNRIHRPGQF